MSRWLVVMVATVFLVCCKSKPTGSADSPPVRPTEPATRMEFSPAPDKWDFYSTKINNSTAFVMVNFWFGDRAPLKDFGHLLWVFIEMEAPGPHGVGLAEEAENTGPIEDALFAHLQSTLEAHYAGRIRGEGSWQLYFYGRDTAGFKAAVDDFMANHPDRKYSIGDKPDPAWEVFQTVLFPDDERMAWITDRQVVERLENNGDPLIEPRQVDHWIYFKNKANRGRFENAAGKLGFKTQQSEEAETDAEPYEIQIHRDDHVDLERIHTVVMELKALAAKHGGEYDGWETFVVSPL